MSTNSEPARPGGNASSGGGGGGRKRPLDGPNRPSHQKKRNRRHRLCLQCANYHGGTCRVPVCGTCGLNHYAHMACLNAATNLRNRLAMHSGPAQGDVDTSHSTNLSNHQSPTDVEVPVSTAASWPNTIHTQASSQHEFSSEPSHLNEAVTQHDNDNEASLEAHEHYHNDSNSAEGGIEGNTPDTTQHTVPPTLLSISEIEALVDQLIASYLDAANSTNNQPTNTDNQDAEG